MSPKLLVVGLGKTSTHGEQRPKKRGSGVWGLVFCGGVGDFEEVSSSGVAVRRRGSVVVGRRQKGVCKAEVALKAMRLCLYCLLSAVHCWVSRADNGGDRNQVSRGGVARSRVKANNGTFDFDFTFTRHTAHGCVSYRIVHRITDLFDHLSRYAIYSSDPSLENLQGPKRSATSNSLLLR